MLRGLDEKGGRACLQSIREQTAAYSEEHPEMPISYAVGYAMAQDFEECTMRDLFRYADKNMYVDKNRAKMEETAQASQESEKQCLEAGMNGHIAKPVKAKELIEIIHGATGTEITE